MKKILIACLLTISATAAIIAAKPDAVLMNIGGHDITAGEFNYLYNKNKTQQEEPLSVDKYLSLFTDYKLKVLAAEAAGLDTTAKFKKELAGYTFDLARPHLIDSLTLDSLTRLAYNRMHTNVDVSHIMITSDTEANPARRKELLDSLRRCIIAGEPFDSVAVHSSGDPRAKDNHGHIGFITVGSMPYEFEDASFSTPVGEISQPFNTRFGTHIVKVNASRPDRGRVKVRHILKLFRGKTAADTAAALASIDSIAAIVTPANFAEVASRTTDDPSGKKNGGDLPTFGAGQMVLPFEEAAYALADGEISGPIATNYGYHLIYKEKHSPVGTYEAELPAIQKATERDVRHAMAQQAYLNKVASRVNLTTNKNVLAKIDAIIAQGGRTPEILAAIKEIKEPVVTAQASSITIYPATIAEKIQIYTPSAKVSQAFNDELKHQEANMLRNEAIRLLKKDDSDFANLVNEYRDGLLLYEISDKEVWGRPQTDSLGLANFYAAHRDDYKWTEPRFKGLLIMAQSDSLARAAKDYLTENPQITGDAVNIALRKTFGNKVKADRVLAPKGANPIIDYVAFGGKRPAPVGTWTSFAPCRSKILAQPEEVADVKGAASLDYQKQLEADWLRRLHKQYKVKINEKTLKNL